MFIINSEKRGFIVNRLNDKSMFRKTASNPENVKKEGSFSFRKSVAERLSSTFQNKQILDRVPGHDMLTLE